MKHRDQNARLLLMALCVTLGVFLGGGITAKAADAVPYYYYTTDDDGTATLHTDGSCEDYTVVTADMPAVDIGGHGTYVKLGEDNQVTWYVVNSDVEISSAKIITRGTVHLILCDGATLTPTKGIMVDSNSGGYGELNIYGQSVGTGKISGANDDNNYGSIYVNDTRKLRLHGGHITGNQSQGGAVYLAGYSELHMYSGSIHDNEITGNYRECYGGVTLGTDSSKFFLYGGSLYGHSPADLVLRDGAQIEIKCDLGEGWNGGHKIKLNMFDENEEPEGGPITNNWPEGADPANYFESGNDTYRVGFVDYYGTKYPGLSAYYTLTFSPGEGTGTMDSIEVPEGYNTLPECAFTPPDGKVFSKWSYNDGYSDYYFYAGKEGYISGNYTLTAVYAVPLPYQYYTSDGAAHTDSCTDYTFVTSDMTYWRVGYDAEELWYVVQGSVTINSRVEVDASDYYGNKHLYLILCDDAVLNIPKGIYVREYKNNNLTIYAQSSGDHMGRLTIGSVEDNRAGIGGNNSSNNKDGGSIVIHGGDLTVTGGANAAGIGGGCYVNGENVTGGAGGSVTIYGGRVTATGGSGSAGIGGGVGGSNGTLTVSDDLIVQSVETDGSLQVLSSPYETRTQKMIVGKPGEGTFTIFLRDDGWIAPVCVYKSGDGVSNSDSENGLSEGEYMTIDGDFWRLSASKQPVTVQFLEKQLGQVEQDQTVRTVSKIYAVANGTQTGEKYFVLVGDGVIVTVVTNPESPDGKSYVLLNSGDTLTQPEAPDIPTPEGDAYTFLRWERDGYQYAGQAYNFSTPVTESFTLNAVYQRKTHTVSFDSGAASQTVDHGSKAAKPANPSGTATKVFQKWVLAETLRYTDDKGKLTVQSAGTEYNFNQSVKSEVKLKAQWAHRHAYTSRTLKEYLGSLYENSFNSFNDAQHVTTCSACSDYRLEAHNFVNGKCSQCGMTQPVTVYKLRVYLDGSLLQQKDIKKGQTVGLYAPSLSGKRFSKWQISARGGSTRQDVSTSTYLSFSLGSDADLYIVYAAEQPVTPKLYLRPSKYDATHAKIQIDWQLPSNCGVLYAGILTATNRGLQSVKYVTWNDSGTVDAKNLLKKRQDLSFYEKDLQADMRYKMLNNKGYDGGFWKGGHYYTRPVTVYQYSAQNLTRNGSYAVLHQLTSGTIEKYYGPYVYAMGYMVYYNKNETTNNVHYIYTNPVAISASYIPQYTFSVDSNGNLS